ELPLKHAEELWFKDGTIIHKLYITCVAFKVYEGFLSRYSSPFCGLYGASTHIDYVRRVDGCPALCLASGPEDFRILLRAKFSPEWVEHQSGHVVQRTPRARQQRATHHLPATNRCHSRCESGPNDGETSLLPQRALRGHLATAAPPRDGNRRCVRLQLTRAAHASGGWHPRAALEGKESPAPRLLCRRPARYGARHQRALLDAPREPRILERQGGGVQGPSAHGALPLRRPLCADSKDIRDVRGTLQGPCQAGGAAAPC
ncbi:hypothetical protein C8Q72DRAFT_905352, partial [Fomitopsis betulina]